MPTDEQVIRRLAEMQGWTVQQWGVENLYLCLVDRDGKKMFWWGQNATTVAPRWNPLESIADAHECRSALLEENRLRFTLRLVEIVWADECEISSTSRWTEGLLIAASPRQISLAMYAALEEK